MGNLVGIGVYLQNSFKVTERVWREAKSWGNANGKHVFRLEIPFGNFVPRLTIYIPTDISGVFSKW